MIKKQIDKVFSDNVFILDKNESNLNFTLDNNEQKNFYFIDILESKVDFNLNITLMNNNLVNFIFCSLNTKDFKKNINVSINHSNDNSFSSCEVFSINKDNSHTNVDLTAKIESKSLNNNCIQIIRGILLSNGAQIKGKPNLIIDSNNIKAKHSLAIGALNKNHLFYFMSKGISETDSKKLIILGFFNKLLYKISDASVRENLYNKIYKKIGEI